MTLFKRLFRRTDAKLQMAALYASVLERGRNAAWYTKGGVPDTLDGRFDMIAAILSVTLLQLETAGSAQENVWLTELFVDDMDGQLRQIGVGDVVVGKHIGQMMSALGGRLSAYRDALASGGDLPAALRRNLYRGAPPSDEAVEYVATHLREFAQSLRMHPTEELLAGKLPI